MSKRKREEESKRGKKREDRPGTAGTHKENGKTSLPIEAFEKALNTSELDYTISLFEAIVPVDASERERRSEKMKAT